VSAPALVAAALAVLGLGTGPGDALPEAPAVAVVSSRAPLPLPGSAHTPIAVVQELTRAALASEPRAPQSAVVPEAPLRAEAPLARAGTDAIALVSRLGTILMERRGLLGWLTLLFAGLALARSGVRRRPRVRRHRSGQGMHWAARTLVRGGTPRAEASRRTGLPQDAIDALISLDRSTAAPHGQSA